jgi:hypothetical protein
VKPLAAKLLRNYGIEREKGDPVVILEFVTTATITTAVVMTKSGKLKVLPIDALEVVYDRFMKRLLAE